MFFTNTTCKHSANLLEPLIENELQLLPIHMYASIISLDAKYPQVIILSHVTTAVCKVLFFLRILSSPLRLLPQLSMCYL